MRRPLYLLIERQHLTQVLLETRIEFLKQKYIPLLAAFLKTKHDDLNAPAEDDFYWEVIANLDHPPGSDPKAIAPYAFDWIVSLDPTSTKKYAQWALNSFLKGAWRPEDAYKIVEYLEHFDKVHRHMPVEQRDINRYRNLPALYAAMEPHLQAQSQREIDRETDRKMNTEAKVLLDTPEYKIITPLTQEASCYFGRNTQWCTAATHSWNAFTDYNKQGPLYIILDKKHNQRWQFHETTGQYMDENDRMINLERFVQTHPVVAKFFAQHDGEPLGKFYGGIALAQPQGGFIVKDQRGLLGRVLLIAGVNEHNELVKIHDPRVTGFDFGRRFLRDNIPTEFCALLNRLKIGGGSRPTLRLFFGNGRWAPDIEAVGDRIIGDWYRVMMDTTYTSPDGYPYYGLVRNGGLVLAATTHANAIRFFEASSQGPVLKPSRNRPTMLADAEHFEKDAVDLVLHLPEITDWSQEGSFDTRHLSRKQVARLIHAKPDFTVSPSAYMSIYGVTDELKKHIGNALEQILPDKKPHWFGDRLLVDARRDLHEYLWYNQSTKARQRYQNVDILYSEQGRRISGVIIYPSGPQQILSRVPSKMRMQIGKQLQKYAASYEVDNYDPLSAADIWTVIDRSTEHDFLPDEEPREDCLKWYHALSEAVWAGAHHAFEMMVSSAIARHCPDELFFGKDGQYTKEVDLFGPVALLPHIKKLVLLFDTDATALLSSPWWKSLDLKFDLSSLTDGIPHDEFDLTVATASFMAELPKLLISQ